MLPRSRNINIDSPTLKARINDALAHLNKANEEYVKNTYHEPAAFQEVHAQTTNYYCRLRSTLKLLLTEVDKNHIPTHRLDSVLQAIEKLQAATDKKAGSKEFHHFVSKLSAEKLGKSLMIALRGLAAAAITVFTLGTKKDQAKELVVNGVNEVKSRAVLAQSLRMFGAQYKEVYNVDNKPRPIVIA